MILTTHALIGATIGKNVENTWLVIALAFATHFLFDTFRHGEYIRELKTWHDWKRVIIDHIVGFSIIGLSIFATRPDTKVVINMLLGTFFAMLPDLFIVLYEKMNFRFLRIFIRLGQWAHPYPSGSPETLWTLRNAFNDILFSLIATFLLFC